MTSASNNRSNGFPADLDTANQPLTQILIMGRAYTHPSNQDTATVISRIKVVGITNNEKWFYYTCSKCFCRKGVDPVENTFWCASCEDTCNSPLLRYKFQLEVTDMTSTIGLTIIDNVAEMMIGKNVAYLFEEMRVRANTNERPIELQTLIGTHQTVEIKTYTYYDDGKKEGFICTAVFKRTPNSQPPFLTTMSAALPESLVRSTLRTIRASTTPLSTADDTEEEELIDVYSSDEE